MQKNAVFYCFLIYIIICTSITDATHFEGGTITYKVLNTSGSVVSIVLTQTYIYDYTKITCTNSMIANQTPKLTFNSPYLENSMKVNCIQYCNQSGGYIAPTVVSYCTDYSASLGITVGQRSDTINVTNGSYFLVAYQSYSWRQLSLPTTSGSLNTTWSISCLIDLRLRPDGGFNSPPVATIISPVYIPVGVPQYILIPTIDADNDNVRCRFASGTNECGSACPPATLPNGTTLFSNCTLIITGAKVNDWYAIALQIEDFINSTSTTPISSVPVQFLINVQNVSSCSQRPVLTGPISQLGGCVGIQVGQTYIIELTAENFCPNSTTIADIATLSFPIVTKTPIVRNSTQLWSVTLTWTPTASSVGTQILCAVAIDSTNVQSNQYCMSFTVAQGTVPTCPGQVVATTLATTPSTAVSTSTQSSSSLSSLLSTTKTTFISQSTFQYTTYTSLVSTIQSTTSSTTTQSTSVSSSSQVSPSLCSSLSTTKTAFTSQSTLQYTTYTSLVSTIQSTTSSITTQSTSVSRSSQSISTLSSLFSMASTNPTDQSSSQYTTYTSLVSTIQSTTSSTTTQSISVSSSSQIGSSLSSWLSTTKTASTDEPNFQYTTYTSLVSTIQSSTSSTTTQSTLVSVSSQSISTLLSRLIMTSTNPTDQSSFQYTTDTSLISTIQSTTSSTTTQSISVSSSLQVSLFLSSSSSTTKTASTSESISYTTYTTLVSTIQSTTSLTTTQNSSVLSSSETSSTSTSKISATNTNPTNQLNSQYTTIVSMISTMQSVTSMISNLSSLLNVQSSKYSTIPVTASSINMSASTLRSGSSTVSSITVVQQSSYTYQSNSTTQSVVTSSDSTSSFPWFAILAGVLVLLLIALCICCCCCPCCLRLCPCCLCIRRKRRPSEDESPPDDNSVQSSILPQTAYDTLGNSQYLDDDIFPSTRPSSATSSRTADDIQLTGLTGTKNTKPKPHFALPLQRSPRVAPVPDHRMHM